MWNECNCRVIGPFFGTAFLWDWNENSPFQSCGHCWIFQICWHNECSILTASSFRIWNRSAGIPSPPALSVVMLPKALKALRLSYLSLLFFGTLRSDGSIFPFLLCLFLRFFSQLFVRAPQQPCCLCLSFSLEWFWSPLLVNVTNLHP